MAVKYQCPKCEKRYIDWGAEKLQFKCPDCDGETLLLVAMVSGAAPAKKKKPSLKRKAKTKAKTKTKVKAKAKAKAKKTEPDVSLGVSDDDSILPGDSDMPTEDLSALDTIVEVPDVDADDMGDEESGVKKPAKAVPKKKAAAKKAKPKKKAAAKKKK